jgi:hypothetical protein
MKLVDTLDEQRVLEDLVESTKPRVPPECAGLHYLLNTPFRYAAPYPTGSRFRRAGLTAGVFYGSTATATAVAEMAFHRLLFFADAPATPWPTNAGEYTAFSARFRTQAALDLTAAPFTADEARWTDRTDYGACQALADEARGAGVEAVRYASARHAGGVNVALFSCRTFASREPMERQTWRLHLGSQGVRAVCGFPDSRLEFDRSAFTADPRIAALPWDR